LPSTRLTSNAPLAGKKDCYKYNLPIELRIVDAGAEEERGERGVLGREEEDGRELGEEACVCGVFR
jgi:hypothetical protein